MAGESHFDEILIHDHPWQEAQGIHLLADDELEALCIDRARHQLPCRNSPRITYDRLLRQDLRHE